jgi:hypothetical protein
MGTCGNISMTSVPGPKLGERLLTGLAIFLARLGNRSAALSVVDMAMTSLLTQETGGPNVMVTAFRDRQWSRLGLFSARTDDGTRGAS